jgi:hypothetical protein
MSTHLIHKQKVVVNVSNMDKAFSYQNTLSELFANELKFDIEHVLNEVDQTNEVIRIDKLDIDLGAINGEQFSYEFKVKLLSKLKESLQNISHTQTTNVTLVKQSASLVDSFIFFIKRGSLPWYIKKKTMIAFEEDMLKSLSPSDWMFIADWFKQNVIFYKHITERLVLQFSSGFLKQILSATLNENIEVKEWEILLSDLQYLHKENVVENTSTPLFHKPFLLQLFNSLFHKNKLHSLDVLIAEYLLKTISEHEGFIKKPFETRAMEKKLRSKLIKTIIQNIVFFKQKNVVIQTLSTEDVLMTNVSKNWSRLRNKFELNNTASLPTINRKEYDDSLIESSASESELQETKNIKQLIKSTKEEDALFVENCGVILLHPFLESYFNEFSLVENKKFISDDAQKRAVLLLHYLCAGLTEVAEFNLVLQKILCGYNIAEESLPNELIISQQEKDESDKLLQSVIDYWPPLKQTSIEGLQKTFLQREGKLIMKDNGWQLTVEQKTVDILLNKLPWGFSTIRLPWMLDLITIDWC